MLPAVVVLSLAVGFVVGAGTIGVAARRMGRQRREPVWRLEAAARYIEARLPFAVAAELKPEDLRELLRRQMNQLQFAGGTLRAGAAGSASGEADDASAGSEAGAVLGAVADLYAEARAVGMEVDRPAVSAVVDLHLEYLRAIGALVPAGG